MKADVLNKRGMTSFRGQKFHASRVYRRSILCSLLLLFAMLAPKLWAIAGGSISGTVTDPKGLALNGATVTLTEVDTNVKQTTTTDSKGFYSLTELAVGTYEIAIDAPDFKQFHETN